MDVDLTAARLAQRAAEAADAWLTDPLDVGVYRRLVDATLTWRRYTRPMLEGTEAAGRRDIRPAASPGTGAGGPHADHPEQGGAEHDRAEQDSAAGDGAAADLAPSPEHRRPAALSDLVAGDPRAVLAQLTGHLDPPSTGPAQEVGPAGSAGE